MNMQLIINRKEEKIKEKKEAELKYNALGQIAMLSGEGSYLLRKIYKAEGEIDCLKWILSIN
jgi:hypothetical protein